MSRHTTPSKEADCPAMVWDGWLREAAPLLHALLQGPRPASALRAVGGRYGLVQTLAWADQVGLVVSTHDGRWQLTAAGRAEAA